MKNILLFLWIKLLMWLNPIRRYTLIRWIKTGFFTSLTLLFMYALYLGFYRILDYLQTVPFIGNVLIVKLASFVFLTFFTMLVFSNLTASFTTIFFARDIPFILNLPIPISTMFRVKFYETVYHSSWMVLVVLIPFLVAFGTVKSVPIHFYITVLFAFLPFFFIAGSIGVSIGLGLMYFFPSRKIRDTILILLIFLGCGLYVLFRLIEPEKFLRPDGMAEISQYLSFLETPSTSYLPSWWVTRIVCFSGTNYNLMVQYIFFLFGTAAGSIIITDKIARLIYHRTLTAVQQSLRSLKNRTSINYFTRLIIWLFPRTGPVMVKDTKLFLRDTNQWSQLLILVALVIVYLLNIHKLPLDTLYLQNLVAFLNIGLTGFVIAAVGLRFVYPAVSLEGRQMWVLRTAPLYASQIFRAKFFTTLIPVLGLGSVISLISNFFLKVDTIMFIISTGTVVCSITTISGLGTAYGSIYPKLKVDNIMQIESSYGGIMYMVSSVFYIGLTLTILAYPVHQYFLYRMGTVSFPKEAVFFAGLGMLILNLGILIGSVLLGTRAIHRIE